jgi:nucleotide-binding universal stress UspA family protein
MVTRILIPLDGSMTAEQVVPYARTFARGLKLPVELLAVVDVGALLTSVERHGSSTTWPNKNRARAKNISRESRSALLEAE